MSFNLEDFVKKPFALEHFKAFLIELFGEKITFTKPNFKGLDYENSLIRSYCSLCENIRLNSDEMGIFIFTVSSIKAKITLHNELKKILKTSSASAILAIFHEENNNEFRLSLITSGYDYEANKITFSDLKRQSFILGTSRTATSYKALQELLAKKEELTLNLLKERFSQEPLTKEFFDEYKKQFDFIFKALQKANLCNVFADYKGINDTLKAYKAFANKLLGRIVFLYFLQKKFWLGVSKDKAYGDGEADFLHKLFKKAQEKNENFYEKYLCPLFFDSLNLQREDDYMPLFESKIPFLNGSLFEDEFIKNANKKPHFLIAQILDNDFFEKLFELFDRYNFTLEESSPKEVEIAIDPEMLGRIFEAMMDDNKEKGAFYTPREIVHYMAKNALLLHFSKIFPANEKELKALIFNSQSDNDFVRKNAKMIKDELLQLSILDPACGSGAFPMGLLSEMISILESLDKTLESKDKADLKRRIISKCIYGIDIDAGAIEIAKLRFYLSIAVDEEAPKPLPNLDFKFMQGNALISTICGREIIPNSNENKPARKIQKDLFGNADIKELDKIPILDETRTDEIKMLFNAYFSQNDLAEKYKLKFEILSQMKEVFDERIKELDTHIKALKTSITKIGLHVSTDTKSKQEKDLKEFAEYENFKNELLALLDDYKKQDFHSEKLFLYEFFFADIMQSGGFDIVIGNPPYIQLQKIEGEVKENYKNAKFESFASMGDIYQLFYEKSLNLLNEFGVVSLITSNKWMRSSYGSTTRDYFYNNANVFKLIDLGAGVFKSATVDTNIIFYGKSKEKINGERLFNALNFKGDLSDLYLTGNTNETIKALEGKEWVIMDENERSIFEKMSKHKALKDWDININYGIKTGFNEAFIIDEETKNRLIKEDKKSSEIIKPILRGRDIKRYSYDFKNLYLICTFPSLKLDIEKYPSIKKHLLSFGIERLEQTGKKYIIDGQEIKARKKTNNKWFETQDSIAYYKDFEKEKIVWTPVNGIYSFSFIDAGYYFNNSVFMITNNNNNVYELKYLLAILNTTTFKFGNLITPLTKVGNYTYGSKEIIETIPIPKPDTKTQKEIVSLVDKIIEGKKNGIITSELEKQIDSLVYELYGLSEEERKIIENK